ncbi:MAG TPA: metal-binding protein [Cyanothece sp. UBA12306]|nr:metal-binding protein [Cyanothece sp. UBA12306]
MKYTLGYEPKTFGDWAYLAIAQHFNKILKHQAGVIEDKDPEQLHQMRVGMRRLRSTLVGFGTALDLSTLATEKEVGNIAKILGKLRDIDVLEDTLKNFYQPSLPHQEQKYLDQVVDALAKKRKKAYKTVNKIINHQKYIKFKKSFDHWLDNPTYQDIAGISIHKVLPDLLLPQISKLILHPGWLVGINFMQGETQLPQGLSKEEITNLLNNQGLILHDLRKEAKRSRYNMELFTQFYGETYQQYVKNTKQLQTVLGDLQDSFILREFLDKFFQNNIEHKMPTLFDKLKSKRQERWQEWMVLQAKFLDSKVRKDFHLTILQPSLVKSEINNGNHDVEKINSNDSNSIEANNALNNESSSQNEEYIAISE